MIFFKICVVPFAYKPTVPFVVPLFVCMSKSTTEFSAYTPTALSFVNFKVPAFLILFAAVPLSARAILSEDIVAPALFVKLALAPFT